MVLTVAFSMQLQPDGGQDWTSKMAHSYVWQVMPSAESASWAVDRNTSCGISSTAAPGELGFLHGSWIPPERVSRENPMVVIRPFLI